MALELKRHICLEITYDNGMWTVYCEELNIHSMSDISCSHAVDQFFEVMKIMYKGLKQAHKTCVKPGSVVGQALRALDLQTAVRIRSRLQR